MKKEKKQKGKETSKKIISLITKEFGPGNVAFMAKKYQSYSGKADRQAQIYSFLMEKGFSLRKISKVAKKSHNTIRYLVNHETRSIKHETQEKNLAQYPPQNHSERAKSERAKGFKDFRFDSGFVSDFEEEEEEVDASEIRLGRKEEERAEFPISNFQFSNNNQFPNSKNDNDLSRERKSGDRNCQSNQRTFHLENCRYII